MTMSASNAGRLLVALTRRLSPSRTLPRLRRHPQVQQLLTADLPALGHAVLPETLTAWLKLGWVWKDKQMLDGALSAARSCAWTPRSLSAAVLAVRSPEAHEVLAEQIAKLGLDRLTLHGHLGRTVTALHGSGVLMKNPFLMPAVVAVLQQLHTALSAADLVELLQVASTVGLLEPATTQGLLPRFSHIRTEAEADCALRVLQIVNADHHDHSALHRLVSKQLITTLPSVPADVAVQIIDTVSQGKSQSRSVVQQVLKFIAQARLPPDTAAAALAHLSTVAPHAPPQWVAAAIRTTVTALAECQVPVSWDLLVALWTATAMWRGLLSGSQSEAIMSSLAALTPHGAIPPAHLRSLCWALAVIPKTRGSWTPVLQTALQQVSAHMSSLRLQTIVVAVWASEVQDVMSPKLCSLVLEHIQRPGVRDAMLSMSLSSRSTLAWSLASANLLPTPLARQLIGNALQATKLDAHSLRRFYQAVLGSVDLRQAPPDAAGFMLWLSTATGLADWQLFKLRMAMVEAKQQPSQLHKQVSAALTELGITHCNEHVTPLGYIVDIAIPDRKLAVEVNGPQHYYDTELRAGSQLKHRCLAAAGWRLLHLHHSDVDAALTAGTLSSFLRSQLLV